MRSPSPPPAPNPREIAQTDAEFNRINQITPAGSLTFSGPNRNTANLEFSPEVQALFEQQQQVDSNLLGDALQRQNFLNPNPIDLSQFGPIQAGFDTNGLQAQGPQFGGLPNLTAPELQQSAPGGPIQGQLNTEGLNPIPGDIQAFRGNVEQAFFDRSRALLDPVFQDQERSLRNRLANRGLPEGGEAFDRDFTRFSDARNRAFTDVANSAVLAGGSEASRQLGDTLAARGQGFGEAVAGGTFANQAQGQGFGQDLSQTAFNNQAGLLGLGANQGIRGQLTGENLAQTAASNQAAAQNTALQQQVLQNANAARLQGLSEAQGVRGNQFNELASLLGLQQVQQPGLNNFFAPSQVDVTGANALQQNALQNQFLAESGQANAFNTGLFGLGGAAIGAPSGGFFSGLFSDRRLKRNIKRIGTVKGYPWYSFEYLWGEKSEGIMSDEIPQRYVSKVDGFDWVDYGGLLSA